MAKQTIIVTQQVEVEVEFPMYLKVNQNTFCLFIAENVAIKVETYEFSFGIEWSSNMPESWLACKKITKEEFESEFKKVQEKINQLL